MGSVALITVIVFICVYIVIAFEWLNKAIAALLGVMGIAAVLKKTGFFNLIPVYMGTFCHDFIDLEMVDHLITEKGEAVPSSGSPQGIH